MAQQREKCVLLLDIGLAPGLAANAAVILGITLGKLRPELVGPDVTDQDGTLHAGIVEIPVPVLGSSPGMIRALRAKLGQPEFQDVTSVDFTDLAQRCRTYREFIDQMGQAREDDLGYIGLALWGPKKKVDRLTGALPLL